MKQAIYQERFTNILHLKGRFDVYNVAFLQTWVEQELSQHGNSYLLIDLEQVNFVDMAALIAFAEETKRCRQQQGDLVLCNLQPAVQIILDLTHFDAQLTTCSTLNEAFEAIEHREMREVKKAVLAV